MGAMPRRPFITTSGGIQRREGAQRGNIPRQFAEGLFRVLQWEQQNHQIFMHPHLTLPSLGWRTCFLKEQKWEHPSPEGQPPELPCSVAHLSPP